MMHDQVHCRDEAANHQLPIAVAVRRNIEVVILINCFAWRGVLMMDNTFPIQWKNS